MTAEMMQQQLAGLMGQEPLQLACRLGMLGCTACRPEREDGPARSSEGKMCQYRAVLTACQRARSAGASRVTRPPAERIATTAVIGEHPGADGEKEDTHSGSASSSSVRSVGDRPKAVASLRTASYHLKCDTPRPSRGDHVGIGKQ